MSKKYFAPYCSTALAKLFLGELIKTFHNQGYGTLGYGLFHPIECTNTNPVTFNTILGSVILGRRYFIIKTKKGKLKIRRCLIASRRYLLVRPTRAWLGLVDKLKKLV